jgi:hypothetical protein
MSAPANTPYLSRFFLKFIEIIAAGLATAASGYLIAHLSGALPSSSPSPTPATAVIQVSPSANTVSNLPAEPNTSSASMISNAPGQAIAPNANIPSSPAAQAIPPISGGANDQRLPSQQGINAPSVPQPQRKTVSTTKPETATVAREQSSFVSRVRAALTKAEAKHADGVSPPQGNATPAPAPAIQTDPARAAIVPSAPSAAAALSSPPAQESPVKPSPSAPVEITSRPIVGLQAPPAPPVEQETGGLSALEQMLRHDPLQMRDDEVPRPPMPVGQ